MKVLSLLSSLIVLHPALVMAAADSSSSELVTSGMRVVGALVLVIGLMLLLYALAKKRFKLLPGHRQGAIQVIEMRYLAPKKAVALVKVRGQELLLGVGQEQVSLLHTIEQDQPFERTLQQKLEDQS